MTAPSRGCSALSERCSGTVAIDGHAVGSGSRRNDLSSKGHEFPEPGEPQVNLLMALDAKTGRPICSRLCEGRAIDKTAVHDPSGQVAFRNVTFVVDRGLDGDDNEALFLENGNSYVFPLNSSDNRCKEAARKLDDLSDRFPGTDGGSGTAVEYAERTIDGRRVIVYRDVTEQLMTQESYLRHLERGDKGYTKEGYEKLSSYMGVYVLQTSLSKDEHDAKAVFELYKKRWSIETYFDYFRCGRDGHTLCQQDYYKQQGLAFMMLVSGLIECEVRGKISAAKVNMSVTDVLMDARAVKIDRVGGVWEANSCVKNREAMLRKLGVGLEAIRKQQTAPAA